MRIAAAGLIACLLAVSACGGPGSGLGPGLGGGGLGGGGTGNANVTITVGTDAFRPPNVTIPDGGTVTWAWKSDSVLHNVTFRAVGAPPNMANRTTGSESRLFNRPGAFPYECTNHPGMTGTVTVE